jgi:hypothetical protein
MVSQANPFIIFLYRASWHCIIDDESTAFIEKRGEDGFGHETCTFYAVTIIDVNIAALAIASWHMLTN